MEKHKKAWTFYLFASANVLKQYSYDQLVRLGVSWVWLGLEGKQSQYNKLHGTDSHGLVKELQSHGIRVLGSSIIGLEEHTPENIDEAIEFAVSHDSDFHQFMLYTPLPGTGLHREMSGKDLLVDETQCDLPEVHGQHKFNFKHPHIRDGQETEYLLRAFRRDFEANGPSIVRMVRTMLTGWQRYKNHPDERETFAQLMMGLTIADAPGIATRYPWREVGLVCDVGGGRGTLLSELLVRHQHLRGMLVDGAGVIESARGLLAARGVGKSAKYQRSTSGSMRCSIGVKSLSAMAPKTACVVG